MAVVANFADSELPVGSAVVALLAAAAALAVYIWGGVSGSAVSEEERRHWDEERRRRRLLIEECVRGASAGRANPIRIWEALYDEAEGSFVTAPPFGLGPELPAVPTSWFADLAQALGEQVAGLLRQAGQALEEAEARVQHCLRAGGGTGDRKALDARREERAARLTQLGELVKRAERMAKAFRVDRPPTQLPKAFAAELGRARELLTEQEQIRRGLTWQIGLLVVDAQIAGWLALGVCLKVLMGAPAPLQVLALSDAARGMERGGAQGYEEFATAIGNCFLFFCMEKLLQFLARITMIRGEFLFTQTLQRKVYSKMLQQDYEYFDGKPTAALQNLVYVSTEGVCSSLIFMRVRIIQALATVFFQVVLIAWRFPALALVVNMSLPIAGALRFYSKGYIERSGARLKARGNIVGQRTWDVLSNLPTVRSYCREAGAVEDYARSMAYQARVNTKLHMFNGISQPFLHFCDMICVYVGYYYGGHLIHTGSLTTAELMTVIRQFQTVASELSYMMDTIASSMLATEHGRDILDLLLSRPKIEPELQPNGHAAREALCGGEPRKPPGRLLNTEIEFRQVIFSYPNALARGGMEEETRVLRGLSFIARHGEFTALVGRTGCGKSTVTLLLQRLYDTCGGAVLVGGVDVREQDVRRLRRSIAVVCQEPVLFSTTIYENLLYAFQEQDEAVASLGPAEREERMAEACRRADAWDFVQRLQDGLRTDVGPRGSQLSGGQKQRLAVARAILKDAPLLVLDEATSSLDVEAERAVQQALDQLIGAGAAGGCPVTRLVIAHRLCTIRRADKIVAIEGGVVCEEGTHEELVAKEGGLYARFLRLSLGGDAEVRSSPGGQEAASPGSCASRCHERPPVSAAPAAAAGAEHGLEHAVANGHVPQSEGLRHAYGELRACFAALRAELPSGCAAEAVAEEVERCQQRLGALMGERPESQGG